MKQEIKRIGLFVILPLLLTTLALSYVGEADGFESEEKTVHALASPMFPDTVASAKIAIIATIPMDLVVCFMHHFGTRLKIMSAKKCS